MLKRRRSFSTPAVPCVPSLGRTYVHDPAAYGVKDGSVIVGRGELDTLAGRVTMVDGGFDPLHPGHLAYFRAAAALGLPLLCNVRDDTYLTEVKGRPPLLPHAARAELLDSLETVAYVHPCTTSTLDVLRKLRPRMYAKGADWRGRLPAPETRLCAREGIDIVFLDTVRGSSTQLVRDFVARAEEGRQDNQPPVIAKPEPLPQAQVFGCIGSTHMNRYLSGVARFNHLLGERLRVPCLTFTEAAALGDAPVLLSVKFSDSSHAEIRAFEAAATRLVRRRAPFALFFHSFDGHPLERQLAEEAFTVFAGNAEIASRLRAVDVPSLALWCPSLLDGENLLGRDHLTLFSFGMSHKMQPAHYLTLHELLDDAEIAHTLLVSTAFHEKAHFGDVDEIAQGFRRIFGPTVHLLGFLSDAAVGHFLGRADVFCAFFPSGVRANNTSVAAAMSRGVPVLTNLDAFSPAWMDHGHNVLDIARLVPTDFAPTRLASLARQARCDVEAHAGWSALAHAMTTSCERDCATVPAVTDGYTPAFAAAVPYASTRR